MRPARTAGLVAGVLLSGLLTGCGTAARAARADFPRADLQAEAMRQAEVVMPEAVRILGRPAYSFAGPGTCNLEPGTGTWLVHTYVPLHAAADFDQDAVVARLATALEPEGFRPMAEPYDSILTDGSVEVTVRGSFEVTPGGATAGEGPRTRSGGVVVVVRSDCVEVDRDTLAALAAAPGPEPIDPARWR